MGQVTVYLDDETEARARAALTPFDTNTVLDYFKRVWTVPGLTVVERARRVSAVGTRRGPRSPIEVRYFNFLRQQESPG
jgi:hypothetical protein